MDLVTALAWLALAPVSAQSEAAPPIASSASGEWVIRGVEDGRVRIRAADGTVLETRRVRLVVPRDGDGGARVCTVEGQADGTMLMALETPQADGTTHRHRARTKVMIVDAETGAVELGPGHVNLERAPSSVLRR